MVKFPNVKVKLVGEDGNALMIIGRVRKAMKREGISEEDIKNYTEDAMSGDYDHLLYVTMETCNCDCEDE